MGAHEFLTTVTIILALMALIALGELAVPMFTRPSIRRGRSTANLGLTVLTLTFNWLLNGVAAIIAVALSLQGPGFMTWLGIPIGVQIVVSVAALDLSFGYLAHRAMHLSPTLWRVHRVHHCDPFVDVTTTYRNHPIESLWRFLFVITPVWVLGVPPEAVVIHRLLSALNGILEHANLGLWRPLDRSLSLLWVSPHMHKVHHSRDQVETDSNYGNILSIYDRMLGTFTPTEQAFAVCYGLADVDPTRATSLPGLLAMPFEANESGACEPAAVSGLPQPKETTQMTKRIAVVMTLLMACALGRMARAAESPKLDIAVIEELTGVKGKLDEKEGVFKVSVPRSDLAVSAAGVRLTPPMGLTTWAAFKRSGTHTMVMGDIVLLEDQVNPVMSVALDNGLEVTALHNHFLWDTPKVMFMHIGGMGDTTTLAAAVGKIVAKLKETSSTKGEVPTVDIDPAKTSLAPEKIEAILGVKGDLKDGVYKVVIGRIAKMHGTDIGNTMGVNTWAAFAGSDDKAVVDGDFAMLEPELQGVLKALRGAGINVVAIHQHMTGEVPRIMFLHYWGIGPTPSLAKGLKAALDTQKH